MTHLLYLTQPKNFAIYATVREIKQTQNGYATILDKTIFHPKGGGQPDDKGLLNGINITGAVKLSGSVLHETSEINWKVGQIVAIQIDPLHRNTHSIWT
jgi:alanyl-tRNA synthetase